MKYQSFRFVFWAILCAVSLTGCGGNAAYKGAIAPPDAAPTSDYLIGPGDSLQVSVWRNPELSTTIEVRPDGKISTPLVEDIQAVGKTPTQLGRDIEVALAEFVKSPRVTIIVGNFIGTFSEQIRVVGRATAPQSLAYRDKMTLLDVMIEVGGLAPGASGNRAKIIRWVDSEQVELKVKLHDLINRGKIEENVMMLPGDILLIPESRL